MDTYLVGGAVRDELLGIPVKDRDWVVVGTTPEQMEKAGFKAVGRDFPVFLHPKTHEEYALARTERKTGPGYHGFHFNTDITVSLEDDLLRRDLTINAIAKNGDDDLIDPHNGQQDITNKVLRHVSPAFMEDPVRVLRIAKFMARFSHLGFTVHDSTSQLIKDMVSSGEVDNLVAERVWQEFNAALISQTPSAFFTTMLNTNALDRIMPELSGIVEHKGSLEALDKAAKISDSASMRFASLCTHFNAKNAATLEQFFQRLRAPKDVAELALLSARHTQQCQQAKNLNAKDLHALLKSLDATRRPERFKEFVAAVDVHAATDADHTLHLLTCAEAMANIDAAGIAKSQSDKSKIATAIRHAEIVAIEAMLSN